MFYQIFYPIQVKRYAIFTYIRGKLFYVKFHGKLLLINELPHELPNDLILAN